MQRMKLNELTLINFKGVKDFQLTLNGESTNVYGDNATGKTTIFDAFLWLLFDKDSQNKKDFQIKEVDENNQEVHGLTHEVAAAFQYNDKEVSLKKTYYEKWTKPRGAAKKKFSGHTNDYFVDGVPVKKKEFDNKVKELVDEDVFKLLTSPTYFNEQLKWQERRNTLLAVGGDIQDEEVFSSNTKLQELKKQLGDRSVEDHKRVIAAKKKEINNELERIPVRVDEVHLSMPDLKGFNQDSLQQQQGQLQEQIKEKQEELNTIRSGGQVTAKQNEMRELEGQLLEVKNKHQTDQYSVINEKRSALQELRNLSNGTNQLITDNKNLADRALAEAETASKEAQSLRDEYAEARDRTFAESHEKTCPTCQQSLPEHQVREAHEKALEAFNQKKAADLERITAAGKKASERVSQEHEKAKRAAENRKALVEKAETRKAQMASAEEEIKELEANVSDISKNKEYQTLAQKIAHIEEEIKSLRESESESMTKVQEAFQSLQEEAKEVEGQLSLFTQKQQADKRVAELEEQEQKLAAEFEKLEEQLFLSEEFIRAKVSMLEERISSKFKYARFKLFKVNINGGLEETCETLYNGVPYSAGLNNAAQINVGLDIINTLSDHYGFEAPIFIDNREAVTKLININTQIISLIVSSADSALRIENNQTQEAI